MTVTQVIYVDVDDTLIRSVGSKRIPIARVVKHVALLASQGHELWCWSSGGAAYAHEVAVELGLEKCFAGFLTKPSIMLDDQEPNEWRYLTVRHPNEID